MSGEASPPLRDDLNDGDGINYFEYFVHSELFNSRDEAIEWARAVAKRLGFFLVISTHKIRRDGTVTSIFLDCDRRRKKEPRDLENVVRRNTSRKAVGCKFRVKVVQVVGGFVIDGWNERGFHNHPLMVYMEGHRQVSGLNLAAKKVVHVMSDARAKPHAILVAIRQQFPDLNPNRRHIYNCRAQLRKQKAEGRNPAENFLHLAVKYNYVFWIDATDDGVVTHTFVAHPTSVNLLRTFPYVIAMDTTYKTNKYGMPLLEIIGMTSTNKNFIIGWALMSDETQRSYRWVLQQLKNLIGFRVQPTAIVSDRELALMKPIEDIFPEAAHLLCTWHIGVDVEKQAYKYLGKCHETAKRFANGKWAKVVKSTTDEDFDRAWIQLQETFHWAPRLVRYCNRTWITYKEKFVKAWTNKVLHFGNTTTCRVESAHAALKIWIESPTSSMDTLFETINTATEMQLVEIRADFEASRCKHGTEFDGPPFQHLNGRVSLFALGHIKKEINRMNGFDLYVEERCDCKMYTAYGVPCACRLDRIIRTRRGIYLNEIHRMFQTLQISDGLDIPEFFAEWEQDRAFFLAMVYEVAQQDVSMMRGVSQFMFNHLHPEQLQFEDPRVNENLRGRPRSTATRRDRSAFEYTLGRGRGRPSGSSSMGRGHSSSSVNMASGMSSSFTGRSTETDEFPYRDRVPGCILPFLTGWNDVQGDGNCGFRCVADAFHGGESEWLTARRTIVNELYAHAFIYTGIYFDGLDNAINRIDWRGTWCGEEHYMELVNDLFPIADFYRCAVMCFTLSENGLNPNWSCTVLPWEAEPNLTRPRTEFTIAHLGARFKHFIRLHLEPNFPVPPICTMWHDIHTDSVNGWDLLYQEMRERWDRLTNLRHSPRHVDLTSDDD